VTSQNCDALSKKFGKNGFAPKISFKGHFKNSDRITFIANKATLCGKKMPTFLPKKVGREKHA